MSCMHYVNSRSKYGFLFVVTLAGVIPGCIVPPPEAVLSGTWSFTVQNAPDLKQLLLIFDANGNLLTVQYQVTTNAVIIAPVTNGSTDVNGNAVAFSATFNNNTLSFNGTLNDTQTVATGTLTTSIAVGAATVQINNGPATMTKQ